MLFGAAVLLFHLISGRRCITQLHVQKVVSLFPVLCKPGVTTITAILSEDEGTKIHRTRKLEIVNLTSLRQHLLSMTKNIYELVPFFS